MGLESQFPFQLKRIIRKDKEKMERKLGRAVTGCKYLFFLSRKLGRWQYISEQLLVHETEEQGNKCAPALTLFLRHLFFFLVLIKIEETTKRIWRRDVGNMKNSAPQWFFFKLFFFFLCYCGAVILLSSSICYYLGVSMGLVFIYSHFPFMPIENHIISLVC